MYIFHNGLNYGFGVPIQFHRSDEAEMKCAQSCLSMSFRKHLEVDLGVFLGEIEENVGTRKNKAQNRLFSETPGDRPSLSTNLASTDKPEFVTERGLLP